MEFAIRAGRPEDAEAAIGLIHRSITELCAEDHQNDPEEIAAWLANKTLAAWQGWIGCRDALVLVAEGAPGILGVAMMTVQGKLLLNHVHPQWRFRGVSKALLNALEEKARSLGLAACCADSSETARAFYLAHGYRAEREDPLALCKPL